MTRQRHDLTDRDLEALAGVLGSDAEELRRELERRPWFLNDVLRDPDTADAVLTGEGLAPGDVSPFLFFAVMAHRAAEELADTTWVSDWTGPKSRLPVFDVDPLLEFADDPNRLTFVARLLAGFAMPEPPPVPVGHLDLAGLADWLEAVEPRDRLELLRRLGDLALFQAGVFPDRNGDLRLTPSLAGRLGRSLGLSAEEVLDLVDPASASPGLDALENLGAAWYVAAAERGERSVPTVLHDVAVRMNPARRFLNHLADTQLHRLPLNWA